MHDMSTAVEEMAEKPQQPLRLLQAEVDPDGGENYLRMLKGDRIKYFTIAPGLYALDDMCFEPAIITLLPPFPAGDWNEGFITRNSDDGAPHFDKVIITNLPGIQNAWHDMKLDHLSLKYDPYMLSSGVHLAIHPLFLSKTIIAKFAVWPWEIGYRDQENKSYQLLQGKDIGPEFLGHILEEGRIIGFILERITDARHADATMSDVELCKKKLQQLHQLHILHGDVNKYNFLISKVTGEVTIIDFESARKCEDLEELEKESESLEEQFWDTSGRGGQFVINPEGERRTVGVEGLTVEDPSLENEGGILEADGSNASVGLDKITTDLKAEGTHLSQAIPSELGNPI